MKKDISTEIEVVNGEVIGNDFIDERIDFDNPITILNYGSTLLNEMNSLTQNISSLMSNDEKIELDYADKFLSLGDLSKGLELVDKRREEKEAISKSKVRKLLAEFKGKLPFGKKLEEYEPTYFAEYENYCKKIDEVGAVIEKLKASTLVGIEISKELSNNLQPYVLGLTKLIEVGYSDKERFDNEVVAVLVAEVADSQDGLKLKQLAVAKQKSELLEKKLVELETVLVTMKNTVIETSLSQNPNMSLVIAYDSYVRTTLPTLKMQASSLIETRKQQERIASHQLLVDKTNEVLVKNAEQLKNNIGAANKLMDEGNIRVDTLKKIEKEIGAAVELVKKGQEQILSNRQKNQQTLKEISSTLDTYSDTLQSLVDSEAGFSDENFVPTVYGQGDSSGSKTFIRRYGK